MAVLYYSAVQQHLLPARPTTLVQLFDSTVDSADWTHMEPYAYSWGQAADYFICPYSRGSDPLNVCTQRYIAPPMLYRSACFRFLLKLPLIHCCGASGAGGGLLGIAHVGFVCVLEEAGVRFRGIGGTSAGAINAVIVAASRKDDKGKFDPSQESWEKTLDVSADRPNCGCNTAEMKSRMVPVLHDLRPLQLYDAAAL